MSKKLLHWFIGALLVVGYFASVPDRLWQPPSSFEVPSAATSSPAPSASWRLSAVSDAQTPLVHAASLVELSDGRLRAFWFAGVREGSADVGIHSAVFDPAAGTWSDEARILERTTVVDHFGRHVRKLGNVVPVRDEDGRIRLFVVAVSFGGWAASRLVVAESLDEGDSWQLTDELNLSPFMDISYLVKGNPVRFSDGSIGLPIYHELIGKFGELIRLDKENRVIGRQRIGSGRQGIQPVVFVESKNKASAFLRNELPVQRSNALRSDTVSAGRAWSQMYDSGVSATSAALGGITQSPDHWLMVVNHNGYERDDLTLLESRDAGTTWETNRVFFDRTETSERSVAPNDFRSMIGEELNQFVIDSGSEDQIVERVLHNKCKGGKCEFQYDYPFMLRAANGDIHLVFTWNKSLIGHYWWQANADGKSSSELGEQP